MVLRRMTLRVPARGDLRHIDDGADAGFFGALREIRGSVDDAGPDRIDEIGGANALQGGSNAVDIGEIPYGDLDAARPQRRRSRVIRMDEGPNGQSELQRRVDGGAPGEPCGASHENPICTHQNNSI
jgi:hypothetical protein